MVIGPGPDRLPVSDPSPDRQRRRLPRWVHRTLRRAGCALVVFVVAFVALVGTVAVVLGGEQEDASEAGSVFDREKPRAAPGSGSAAIDLITRRGRLVVAVQELPGLASRHPATRDWTGFDIEIARLIAADLGVDPTRTAFKPIAGRSREAALVDGDVDLVLGYPSAEARRAQVGFVGPYLNSPQPLDRTDYGIALRPGDQVLRARVGDVLRRAVADGTWARLYAEHLGTPVPQPPTVGP